MLSIQMCHLTILFLEFLYEDFFSNETSESQNEEIWKIERLNMTSCRSEKRRESDNDHGGIRVHTQAKNR